jgi:hypothetical protein
MNTVHTATAATALRPTENDITPYVINEAGIITPAMKMTDEKTFGIVDLWNIRKQRRFNRK